MLTTKLSLISEDIEVITTINSCINLSFILNMKEIYLELGLLPIELVGLGTLQIQKCMGFESNCDSLHHHHHHHHALNCRPYLSTCLFFPKLEFIYLPWVKGNKEQKGLIQLLTYSEFSIRLFSISNSNIIIIIYGHWNLIQLQTLEVQSYFF